MMRAYRDQLQNRRLLGNCELAHCWRKITITLTTWFWCSQLVHRSAKRAVLGVPVAYPSSRLTASSGLRQSQILAHNSRARLIQAAVPYRRNVVEASSGFPKTQEERNNSLLSHAVRHPKLKAVVSPPIFFATASRAHAFTMSRHASHAPVSR